MKAKASLLVIALVAAAALLTVGCDRLMTQSSIGGPGANGPVSADPGDTSMVTIWAGQHYDAGYVLIWTYADSVYLSTHTTGSWLMNEWQMAYANSGAGLPRNKPGHLVPGHFPYKAEFSPPETTYTYALPLTNYEAGDTICFAIHVELKASSGDTVFMEEGGWAGQWKGFFSWILPGEQQPTTLPPNESEDAWRDPHTQEIATIPASE